jgi:hypothetical protein
MSVLNKLFNDIFDTAKPINMIGAAALLTSSEVKSAIPQVNKYPPPMLPTKSLPTQVAGNSIAIPQVNKYPHPMLPTQVAGFMKEIDVPVQLYKRVIIIMFILVLAIYCSSVTFRSSSFLNGVLKLHGEETAGDPNLDNENEKYSSKWRRIIQLIVVLSVLSIAYFIAIFVIIFIAIFMYIVFKEDDNYFDLTKTKFKLFFWSYNDKKLLFIYVTLIMILFITIIGFLLYHLFVKSYFKNIEYPQLIENKDQTEDQTEFSNPTKFAMYYGLYLIIIFIFYFILLALYNKNFDGEIKFIFINFFIAIVTLMFIMLIYKYTLNRSKILKVFIIWASYLIFTIISFVCYHKFDDIIDLINKKK